MLDTPAGSAAPSARATPAEASERIYFPELDGLRFIAFLMVYLFHGGVPQPLLARMIGQAPAHAFRDNGGMGVQLFFILSGYLITTLLLREEARFGRISLRAFWVRRILRIWPLYYLIILLGFFILPWLDGGTGSESFRQLLRVHLLPFLGFLGNWSMALVNPVPYDWLSILWSVCVEEQFYLLVPLLVALVWRKARIPLVVGIMGGSIAVRWWCAQQYTSQLMIVFNSFAQFDTLLSGVLLALVLGWERNRPGLTACARRLQWPLYAAVLWVLSRPHLGHDTLWNKTWDYVWVWLCGVGIVVVAVWGHGGWLQKALSGPRIVWLGKISYGLYMYHEIALWAGGRLQGKLPWFEHKEPVMAIVAFTLTLVLAAVSYYGFESYFLRLKKGWTRVPSRPV